MFGVSGRGSRWRAAAAVAADTQADRQADRQTRTGGLMDGPIAAEGGWVGQQRESERSGPIMPLVRRARGAGADGHADVRVLGTGGRHRETHIGAC